MHTCFSAPCVCPALWNLSSSNTLLLFQPFVSCTIGSPSSQPIKPRSKPHKKFSFQLSTHAAEPPVAPAPPSKYPPCIAAGTQNDIWGVPTSLQGLIGSLCVFNDTIQESHVTELWQSGERGLGAWKISRLLYPLERETVFRIGWVGSN